MIRRIDEIVKTTDKAKEVYGIKKTLYTELRFVEKTVTEQDKDRHNYKNWIFYRFRNSNQLKEIEVIQLDGSVKIAYLFGKQGWSYDKTEVEEFKAEWKAEQDEKSKRIRLLKAIDEKFSTEELEKILKNF